jgi:hypothetical protein
MNSNVFVVAGIVVMIGLMNLPFSKHVIQREIRNKKSQSILASNLNESTKRVSKPFTKKPFTMKLFTKGVATAKIPEAVQTMIDKFEIIPTKGDGDCYFHALKHCIDNSDYETKYSTVHAMRQYLSKYIRDNRVDLFKKDTSTDTNPIRILIEYFLDREFELHLYADVLQDYFEFDPDHIKTKDEFIDLDYYINIYCDKVATNGVWADNYVINYVTKAFNICTFVCTSGAVLSPALWPEISDNLKFVYMINLRNGHYESMTKDNKCMWNLKEFLPLQFQYPISDVITCTAWVLKQDGTGDVPQQVKSRLTVEKQQFSSLQLMALKEDVRTGSNNMFNIASENEYLMRNLNI